MVHWNVDFLNLRWYKALIDNFYTNRFVMFASFFTLHFYYLLIFLLVMGFLAGFIDAVAGGGGLISLPALLVTGMPVAYVFGTNKLQSSIGTATATYKYYKNVLINPNTIWQGLIFGFSGVIVGAVVVNHVSNHFMEYIVPILMLGSIIGGYLGANTAIIKGSRVIRPLFMVVVFINILMSFYNLLHTSVINS